MSGKTHWAAGTAITLWITRPHDIPSLVICFGAAAVGSVISDIDIETSNSREKFNWIIGISALSILTIFFVEYWWKLGIVESFLKEGDLVRVFIGFIAFLLVCQFGKNKPHRTFMHSFLACLMLSEIIYMIFPEAAVYFAVAMLSHIGLDLLNKKDVSLLYPMKGGFCFAVCGASGSVNRMLFVVGCVASVILSICSVIGI